MINFENSILNKGDTSRIKKAFLKAMRGKPITVGFLGGSITQGCLSSTPDTCYAALVYKWFKEKFPMSKITYVNAGIGGTPSDFGVARVKDDLLRFKPDFSIVEFSVNDAANDYYMETYEGLIRRILNDKCKTALMLVHNVRYDNMESAEDKHMFIGKYYNLPEVSMKHSVYPEVANGNIKARDITSDDLHPNDLGHLYLSRIIIYSLEKIYDELVTNEKLKIDRKLPKPVTRNGYENSERLQNTNFEAELNGFEEDKEEQHHIMEMFRHGYTAWKKGDSIKFTKECSYITVQYRKSINKPTPVAEIIIDNDAENAVSLDGNFEEDWGDCLYTQPIARALEFKEHTIEIRIKEDHGNMDKVPFYLVSVIVSK